MNSPNRGEVWLVDLGFAAKIRPCLVISIPALDEDRALVTVVPHATITGGARFEVEVETGFLKKGVFDTKNLLTIPYAKLTRKLGTLTDDRMLDIKTRPDSRLLVINDPAEVAKEFGGGATTRVRPL